MERTSDPVVFIHGFLEWGVKTPLFGLIPSFWPVDALNRINPNHIILDVGKASSDHDRAVEAFYQLVGGQCDYGEEHSMRHGHLRFGETFPQDQAFHPHWSEANPIHLVGHSFGATTAIELYQMICKDAFGVGSNYKWVKSITSISGPLSGSTFCSMLGATTESGVPFMSPGYLLVAFFATVWKLQTFSMPWLKRIYDLRMGQWANQTSWRMALSTESAFHTSRDLVLYDLLPVRRVQRNSQLVHMDKIFLLSIVATPKDAHHVPVKDMAMGVLLLWLAFRRKSLVPTKSWRYGLMAMTVALAAEKVQHVDWSKLRLGFWGLTWLIRRYTQQMADSPYDGFDKAQWELNDGVVNTYSQIRPRVGLLADTCDDDDDETSEGLTNIRRIESCVSHMSIDLKTHGNEEAQSGMVRGRWHTYRVDKNHLSGTTWDMEAGDLYLNLFRVLNNVAHEPHVPASY
ncbi:Aste57867_23922 [Aphanomyces stellatus]|uniref:Aste57867_23922 protein n=1 Tax=Aphanomyces stellatus TaxID=120398 RepID=A0A485LQM0_9STRA|nr:hypothetical protein As57867_023849 [Aphanomyces stellatus]VFU00565.1 Aste57867_23922 [Aphanomyces stellatus]